MQKSKYGNVYKSEKGLMLMTKNGPIAVARGVTVRAIFEELNQTRFISMEEFELFIKKRKVPEKAYGIFEENVTTLRFFKDKKGESVLSDIVAKNRTEMMGNIKIPGTSIRLYNYSYCPQCSKIFSFKDVERYYANPVIDEFFNTRKQQIRKDTRMRCDECSTFFLPAVVVSDGMPKDERQMLCRCQTIDAIEQFYLLNYSEAVLSRKPENLLTEGSRGAWLNDVDISKLKPNPTLIINFIQYTPYHLIPSFVESKNLQNKDVVFGSWFNLN